MSEHSSHQLRDLAEWVDEQWEPVDPRQLRADSEASLEEGGGGERPRSRALLVAACLVVLAVLASGAVVWRHRDEDQLRVVSSGGAWDRVPDFPLVDRSLLLQNPSLWTGQEVLLVGALAAANPTSTTGAETTQPLETPAYNPRTRTWRTLPGVPLTTSSRLHAVWTGTEALTFADTAAPFTTTTPAPGAPRALDCSGAPSASTYGVAALNPQTGTWRNLSAPPVDLGPITGVAWGRGRALLLFRTGCMLEYNPGTDTYEPRSGEPDFGSRTPNEPNPEIDPSIVAWPGTDVILANRSHLYRYVPSTGATTTMADPPFGEPDEMAWTGDKLVVVDPITARTAAWDYPTNTWVELARSPLSARTAGLTPPVWTGSELVAWGGTTGTGTSASGVPTTTAPATDGAAYNPATNAWTTTGPWPGPAAINTIPVRAGDTLFVWGGGNPRGSRNGMLYAAMWISPTPGPPHRGTPVSDSTGRTIGYLKQTPQDPANPNPAGDEPDPRGGLIVVDEAGRPVGRMDPQFIPDDPNASTPASAPGTTSGLPGRGPTQPSGPVAVAGHGALGDTRVWPADTDTVTGTVTEAAQQFATNVLGLPDANITPSPDARGPTTVEIRQPGAGSTTALFVPRPGGAWSVVQVGGGETSYSPPTKSLAFATAAGADPTASFVLTSQPGTGTNKRALTATELAAGRVEVGAINSYVLVLGDTQGRFITAIGGTLTLLN